MSIQLGCQVYSMREEAARDLFGVLRALKTIGYDGVEFAGLYGHSAEEVAAMLKDVGLAALSSHVGLPACTADMFRIIADTLALGCPYIAISYLDEATRPGAPGFASALSRILRFGALCREAGIALLYHNHDFEFCSLSGQYGLDFLYDATDPALLQTELDTCWVNVAGESPAAYIRKYAGRCPVVHLKDFVGSRKHGAEVPFCFRPVGYGVQDVPAIVRAGLESGTHVFIVEQDLSPERPPLEAARMSCAFVRDLGLFA